MSESHGAAGRIADSMKQKVGDIAAEAARNAVESNIDEAAATADDRFGALIDGAAGAADWLSGAVRAQPLVAVLCAAAVGFVLARA